MNKMQLSLIVRGQHPPGDIVARCQDDLELVQRAGPRLGATVEWIFQLRGDKPV